MRGWRTIKSVVRVLKQSCGNLACFEAVLRPPENAQKSQKSEHVENLVFDVAAALRPCFFAPQPHETQKCVVADRCTAATRLT